MQVNGKQLAKILRLTPARITQLKGEGVFQATENNKYILEDCVPRYVDFKIKDGLGECVEYEIEHALLEKAKREKAEILLAALKGEMHRAADVEYAVTDMIANAKAKLRAVPVKIAPRLCGRFDIPTARSGEVQGLLLREVDDCLTELAGYSPGLFTESDADDEEDS